MSAFTAEMEKWFHPHIVKVVEAEIARLENRIRLLETKMGIEVPQVAPSQGDGGVAPANPPAAQ